MVGEMNGKNLKIAVVTARFNEIVTDKLREGAIATLKRHGVENILEVEVPGAFELPGVASKIAASHKLDAIICVGAVIRGETPHFDQVVSGSTSGMMHVSLQSSLPVINAVLTTDTVEQALNRAGLKAGNKGSEAAACAVEMANLYKAL